MITLAKAVAIDANDGSDLFEAALPPVITNCYTERAERLAKGERIVFTSTVFGPCVPTVSKIDDIKVDWDSKSGKYEDMVYSAIIWTECGNLIIVPAHQDMMCLMSVTKIDY